MRSVRKTWAKVATFGFGVVTLGCAGLFGGSNSGNTESGGEGGTPGPITLQNLSSSSICTLEVWQGGAEPDYTSVDLSGSPLAQGGSTTVQLAGTAYGLRLVECGNQNVLWDSYDPANNQAHNSIHPDGRPFVLVDAGATADGNVLTVSSRAMSEYVPNAGSFQGEYGDQALQTAREFRDAHNYSEQFVGATVIDSDWEIARHRISGDVLYRWMRTTIGQQWPNGHCSIQNMAMMQQHDGSDFSSNFRTEGMDAMSQHQVPCAALELLASH